MEPCNSFNTLCILYANFMCSSGRTTKLRLDPDADVHCSCSLGFFLFLPNEHLNVSCSGCAFPCTVCCHTACFLLRYIRRYFSKVQGFSIRQLLPNNQTLLACGVVATALAASNAHFMAPQQLAQHGFWRQAGLHVGVGVGCLAALALRLVKAERATLSQASGLRQKQQ